MNNKTLRVLVFPCGAENASEIHQALRYSVHVELYGASSVEDHGRYRFERYIGGLPNISDDRFDQSFEDVIDDLNIDIVFATHDTVQEHLAALAAINMNFYLVNGDPRTASITRQKSLTYALFADCPWAPKTFANASEVAEWPVVLKPDKGQGGQGVHLIGEADQISHAAVESPILVEFLPGEEITVDCFSDRKQRLLWVGPRTRERVRAGITMRSRALELTREIQVIADTVNERLNLRGPWFLQLKRDRFGRFKLLEVCCRTGGAMVMQRARGVNLPLMAIQDFLQRDLVPLPNPYVCTIDRNLATRAFLDFDYDTVVIDFDDTLVVDGVANPHAVAFLYQSIADGKRIILLTRHAHDLSETMKRLRIAPNLFDQIVHIGVNDKKLDHVSNRSIFIDNHFPERAAVWAACRIPVLDVDAIEFFLR